MPAWKWLIFIVFIVLVLGLSLFLFCTLKYLVRVLERKRGELNIKKLGEIIKIARNKLNLTLSDLSRISDISEIELW